MVESESMPQAQAEPLPINVIGVVVNNNNSRELSTTDKMIECYNLRRTVKILCCIDIFFGILYSLNYPMYIIPAIIAIGGYYGAKNYNSSMILFYFIIITFNWISKLGLYIYTLYSSDINDSINYNWVAAAIITLINIWISKIVYKYWKCLKEISISELDRLKHLYLINNSFIYW